MFTEKQLVEFGNFLLKTYNVQVHSNDGKNNPIYLRQVTDADFCNWKDEAKPDELQTPSRFQLDDQVTFFSMPDDPRIQSFPGLPAQVIAIHFFHGKVKYDIDLLFAGDQRSRIYNVDSVLVTPRD